MGRASLDVFSPARDGQRCDAAFRSSLSVFIHGALNIYLPRLLSLLVALSSDSRTSGMAGDSPYARTPGTSEITVICGGG